MSDGVVMSIPIYLSKNPYWYLANQCIDIQSYTSVFRSGFMSELYEIEQLNNVRTVKSISPNCWIKKT